MNASASSIAAYDFAYQNAFGGRALRISNGQTSGGFGNQTFSTSTPNEAGETTAESMGLSGGERQNKFRASFTIASALPGLTEPGLSLTVSPDRGDGARMGYLRFDDNGAGGFDVIWLDYSAGGILNPTHNLGTISNDAPHRVTIEIEFFDGPSNDVVHVLIDGVDVTPTEGLTTWEEYSRSVPSEPPTVDSLLFRTAITAESLGGDSAALMGYGFLIDNVATTTPAVAASGPSGATGPAGADGQAGAPGRDGAAPTLASAMKFGSGSVKRRGRNLRVPIVCNTSSVATCVGTLEVRRGKKLLASRGFAIAPGTRSASLTLRQRVRRNTRLRLTLRSFSPTGSSSRRAKTVRVR